MEEDSEKLTRRILDLTLEIICLLTGEDYTVVKKISGEHLMSGGNGNIMEIPPASLARSNEENILKATNKITELLTGEVPIRCQDVAVYFSMEEVDYLGEQCDLYEAAMMEDQPDGSRKVRWPRPLHSQGSAQEEHRTPQEDEDEDVIFIKVDHVDHKDASVKGEEPCAEEEISPHISLDGRYIWKNLRKNPSSPANCKRDNHHIATRPLQQISMRSNCRSASPSPDPITHRGAFSLHSPTVRSPTENNEGDALHCLDSDDGFTKKPPPIARHTPLPDMKLHTCAQCGKCFPWRAFLIRHLRTHTGEKPFTCSDCGRSFSQKSALVRHERLHTGEKPYRCWECGKRFGDHSNLAAHERSHASHKLLSCPECGECFDQREQLLSHKKSHTSVGPYFCCVCGKCFSYKSLLIRHQRSHSGEKPFACPECGKCFAWRSALTRHEKIHAT